RFLVEKSSGAQMAVKLPIVGLVKLPRIDAEFFEQPFCIRAVASGTFDGLRAAVAEKHSAGHLELVALGVSAEIVVVVQNQNFRTLPHLLAETVGCGQTADSRPQRPDRTFRQSAPARPALLHFRHRAFDEPW